MRLICAVDGFVMNVVYDGSFIVLIVLLKTQCVRLTSKVNNAKRHQRFEWWT